MKIERVMTEAVEVSQRLRAVDDARVKALADSMDAIGLRQPITVWSQSGEQLDLVAGAHRLEAALFLGWEYIDAIFLDGSDIDRQLWEIDENLMRSELTATQQAEHLAKRKELWEMRGLGGTSCPTKPQHQRQFAAETAEATGVSKRNVNRATARAEQVSEEARDVIRGTKLDTGVFLDELKGVDRDRQATYAREELNAPKFSTARDRIEIKSDAEVVADEVADMVRRWNKLSPEARAMFLEEIDQPIMDRKFG